LSFKHAYRCEYIAHRGCMNTIPESALKVGPGKGSLAAPVN